MRQSSTQRGGIPLPARARDREGAQAVRLSGPQRQRSPGEPGRRKAGRLRPQTRNPGDDEVARDLDLSDGRLAAMWLQRRCVH